MVVCQTCGHENVGGARFCNGCGSPLTPLVAEVRKTVTVVFCDLVGSTALGERSDPEVLRDLMRRYHAELRRLLELHGGTVEKFVGDAAMAVFGIPQVHEDDALRAVRAAVAMLEAVSTLGLQVRIGVNTGEVVAGTGETLVTGDAVNVAARLEQAAGAGQILVGAATERLVRDAVLLEPLDPLAVKGKSDRVPAFRVVRMQSAKGRLGGGAPFVGRVSELDLLRETLRLAVDKRLPQLVTLVGEPGIGKSRLVEELVEHADVQVLVGRCLSYGEGITYWPLVEILESLGDLGNTLGGSDDAALVTVRLTAAVGVPGTAASPDEIAWAFRRLVETVARARPLVVVFDDIHWAEPTLLDLVEYVATFTQDAPVMLLCTARPELFDLRPRWGAPRPNATIVRLEPLEPTHVGLLVGYLGDVPDEVRGRISESAEGNPLFVEQLVAMHQESPGADLVVPPNLQALLAARIDRLDESERIVIERASVEGRLFHRGAVVELLPEQSRSDVASRLMGLVHRELIQPERPTLPGDDAFRFGHLLVRDAAYESMPKRVRAELHEKYAGWLQNRLGADAPPEIVAYHLEQTYSYRRELDLPAEDAAARASEAFRAAAKAAAARGDAAAGAKLLERALEVTADPVLRAPLLASLARTRRELGDLDGAATAAEEAIQVAEQSGAGEIEKVARLERAHLHLFRQAGDGPDLALAEARAVIEAAAPDEHVALSHAWSLVALTANVSGRHAQILPAVERARQHISAVGDEGLEVQLSGPMGAALVYGPTPVDEGIKKVEDTVARLGHAPFIQGMALHVLGHLRARCGDFEGAEYSVRTWRDHMRELGRELAYADTATCAWDIYALSGDYAAGERELREAQQIIDRVNVPKMRSENAAWQAEAAYLLGKPDEAERLSAISAGIAPDDPMTGPVWRSALAKVRSAQGAHAEAVTLARSAAELADTTDMLDLRAGCQLGLAEVLRAAGDLAAARTAAQEAIQLYGQKGNRVGAARGRQFADSLGSCST